MTLLDHIKNLTVKEPETSRKRKLYKTKCVIGEGTFGIVREATFTPTGRQVALKSIRKRGHDSPEEVAAAVHREMAVLQQLRHPNIIALLDWFETKEKYYLVFELATGGELYDRIAKRGKFTERDAVRIIFTILHAVQFLHDKGIVHRDLKPENLLYRTMDEDADLVIADFGVANFVNGNELLSTLCGSPMYAAPEVIKRVGHGKPADIWSIGVITYCLLAGYPPFDYAEDMADLLDAITHAKYEFDTPYWSAISEQAKDFVRTLLRVKPEDRPSAEKAMIHPWLCQHSQRARDARDALAAGKPVPPTVQIIEPAKEKKDVTIAASTAPPPTASKLPPPTTREEEELPNLVDHVWSAHSNSLFNARGKLLSVFKTVQAMRRMELESARKGSEDRSATSSCESLPATPVE
ncbi:kinase-like domain-containing protein [Fimicolochytrium jonesii]|uniref:kinase-like domain-containing protein n=1 Tax=Fimicolochytrium jonesii TaxID=1396493 RepID=UPI0022FDC7F7|nr:kinase-like domain-containing protein [Fimicolochytrium jonesii]KAI8822170.1 kinase-like domain-containing protein [Fimicolochytrium jonesii]